MNKTLTEREKQIMDLVIEGMTNKDIAILSHTKESTVKNQIYLIYKKLVVRNRAQAAICYSRTRLLGEITSRQGKL